jgi:hypothetical protein
MNCPNLFMAAVLDVLFAVDEAFVLFNLWAMRESIGCANAEAVGFLRL